MSDLNYQRIMGKLSRAGQALVNRLATPTGPAAAPDASNNEYSQALRCQWERFSFWVVDTSDHSKFLPSAYYSAASKV